MPWLEVYNFEGKMKDSLSLSTSQCYLNYSNDDGPTLVTSSQQSTAQLTFTRHHDHFLLKVLPSARPIRLNGRHYGPGDSICISYGDRILAGIYCFVYAEDSLSTISESYIKSTADLSATRVLPDLQTPAYLHRFRQLIESGSNVETLLEKAMSICLELVPFDEVTVELWNSDEPTDLRAVRSSRSGVSIRSRLEISQTMLIRMKQTARPCLFKKSRPNEGNVRGITKDSVQRAICAPVLFRGVVRGCIYGLDTTCMHDIGELEASIFGELGAIVGLLSHATSLSVAPSKLRQPKNRPPPASDYYFADALVKGIRKFAAVDFIVHLTGESGVGKTTIAQHIHRLSTRSSRPFLALNCAAFAWDMLERELFGVAANSGFPNTPRECCPGILEKADGGSVFLDDMDKMDLRHQEKILQLLDCRIFRRVAGNSYIEVDVRFIVASTRNLQQAVKDGAFLDQLWYRIGGDINDFCIPPLRDRVEEIPLMAPAILARIKKQALITHEIGISSDAMDALVKRNWSTRNIRELEDFFRYALLHHRDITEIRPEHLPEDPRVSTETHRSLGSGQFDAPSGIVVAKEPGRLRASFPPVESSEFRHYTLSRSLTPLEENQARYLLEVLNSGINITKAARILGFSQRSLLYNRLKKFGIQRVNRAEEYAVARTSAD